MKPALVFPSLAIFVAACLIGAVGAAAAPANAKMCRIDPPKPTGECRVYCYFGCGVTYEAKNLQMNPRKDPCSRYCKNGPNGAMVEVQREDGTYVARDLAIKMGLAPNAPQQPQTKQQPPVTKCEQGGSPYGDNNCIRNVPIVPTQKRI